VKLSIITARRSTPFTTALVFPLPQGGPVKVHALFVQLTTSADIADRVLAVQLGAINFVLAQVHNPIGVPQTAGFTTNYSAAIGLAWGVDDTLTRIMIPLPDIWLPQGATLAVTVDSAAAADTWAPELCLALVEEQ
jgi:hypothetical protein